MSNQAYQEKYGETKSGQESLVGKSIDEIRELAKTNRYTPREIRQAVLEANGDMQRANELREGTPKHRLERNIGKANRRAAKQWADAHEDYIQSDAKGNYYIDDYGNQVNYIKTKSGIKQVRDAEVLPEQYNTKALRRQARRAGKIRHIS